MDVLFDLHARLATAIVLYLAAVGIWGIVLGIRRTGPTPAYRGAIAVAVAVSVAQGLAGLAVLLGRGVSNSIHVLYGVALVVSLPLAATLVRDRQPRGQSIALGIAALFAMGLALRGITTAR